MFRISRLHEIMKALPRCTFDRIVETHQADKHSKGFGCWDQLVAMVYAQLSAASSLRVLETGFNSQRTHHYHLGTAPIRRSTLADANGKRKAEVFAEAARLLMSQTRRQLRREGEGLLYLLDSTSIILKDEIVCFANRHPRGGRRNHYTQPLRRIAVDRPGHDRPLVLATNDLATPASTIAQRYKERWAIELFFKWIKQHLKITQFLGRNANAVHMQILTALIACLLLALHQKAQRFTGSLWVLLAEVRATLFQRPSIESVLYRKRRDALAEISCRQAGLFA